MMAQITQCSTIVLCNVPSPVLLSRERARKPSSPHPCPFGPMVGLLRSPILVLCHCCAFGSVQLRDGANTWANMMPLFPSWVQSTMMRYRLSRPGCGFLRRPLRCLTREWRHRWRRTEQRAACATVWALLFPSSTIKSDNASHVMSD
jgi:hypothetical protein